MVSSVAGFGENLLTMAELQARLSAMELQQNVVAARSAGSVALAGSLLAVACLPVALAGIAELLVSELAIKRGYALLIVSAAAFLIACVCVASTAFCFVANGLASPCRPKSSPAILTGCARFSDIAAGRPRGR